MWIITFLVFLPVVLGSVSPSAHVTKNNTAFSQNNLTLSDYVIFYLSIFGFFTFLFLIALQGIPEGERQDCCPVYVIFILLMMFLFGVLPMITAHEPDTNENSVRPTYKGHFYQIPRYFPPNITNTTIPVTGQPVCIQNVFSSSSTQFSHFFLFSLIKPLFALGDFQIGPETLFPQDFMDNITDLQIMFGLLSVISVSVVVGLCVIKCCLC